MYVCVLRGGDAGAVCWFKARAEWKVYDIA